MAPLPGEEVAAEEPVAVEEEEVQA
jgi:hypothetical protein